MIALIDRNDIKKFFTDWNGRGSEKSDAQSFWLALIRALGVDKPDNIIKFETPIDVDGQKCFIDGLIPSTKVLIEQKSRGIDLDKPAKQSDGKFLTAFEQAKRYADALPYSQHPRWIIVCNFDEFRIYDMDRITAAADDALKPACIAFKHLPIEFARLGFVVDPNDENIDEVKLSKDAVDIMKRIRDAFARKMLAPRRVKDNPVDFLSADQKDILNKFCVRLVFCLYAEDAAVFNTDQFVDYISASADRSAALTELFDVLNTPPDRRDQNLRAELKQFPYVNGGLFDGNALDIPPFDNVTADGITLQARGSEQKFNWFTIDPTIFGALFERDLNAESRRHGGMHYTSRANIHKLIDPLFLDDLAEEFDSIRRRRKNKRRELEAFQDKIASLIFFDPACGSGNFLTETFISLRQLENKIIDELINLGVPCSVKVSIDQFFGIEINGFAAAIAQTAMWISENKMLYDTDISVGIREREHYLPLKHSARIVCANALTVDWKKIVPDGADYIIGNPPFVGASMMSAEQKSEAVAIFGRGKLVNSIDYVGAWYHKAAAFIDGTTTRAAFVSTNSITQGEQVAPLWQKLFVERGVHIDFAYRTFRWLSESEDMAAVHCVIVGFSSAPSDKPRIIFDGDQKIIADNINPYLVDAPDVFIWSRAKPISADAPLMVHGNKPTDNGNLILSTDERDRLLKDDPKIGCCIRRLVGGRELMYGDVRYCLWLNDIDPKIYRDNEVIMRRLDAVKKFRAASTSKDTRERATVPHLFFRTPQTDDNYICLPQTSSDGRKYIPIGFMDGSIIAVDTVLIIPSATLFHFGVLSSSVHMMWMRLVGGRFGTGYRYSTSVVYNNFVWCGWSSSIEETAQAILDARALYPTWTLAAMYDEEKMPPELRAAHAANDLAVMSAYGFDVSMTESELVSALMKIYEEKIIDGGH